MLIDNTFFVGELYLANIDTPVIANTLNYMIEQREPELLTDMLGEAMYEEFMHGLSQAPPAKKWLELLYGSGEWKGLVQFKAATLNLETTAAIAATMTTPTAFTLPEAAQGRGIMLQTEQGERYYTPEDFTIDNETNIVTLHSFTLEEGAMIYVLPFRAQASGAQQSKASPIANYVYYWYLVREAQQTTGVGQAATKSQNSIRVNPMDKLVKAWNEMVNMLHDLCKFLNANRSTYPLWKTEHCRTHGCGCSVHSNKYDYINTLDL